MKKIAVFTRAFDGGGTETALIALLNQLEKMEIEATVFCINKKGVLLHQVPENIGVKEVVFGNSFYQFLVNGEHVRTDSVKILLYKILKKIYVRKYGMEQDRNRLYEYMLSKCEKQSKTYDAVLDFYGYGYFLTAYGAKKVNARKKAMWIHDENIHWIKRVTQYLPSYDKIFCVSEAVKKVFLDKYPQYQEKAEVFYNLIDTEKIVRKAEEEFVDKQFEGELKLVTVGRLEYQKGYDIAIKAARRMTDQDISFCWYIIGEGTERKALEKMIKKEGLKDKVILLGRKENPYPYIKNCDIYVQPSRHEGYGIAILEARVLYKPIIATNLSCVREQIQDGKNGYLVEADGKAFADKIIWLSRSKEAQNKVMEMLKREKIDFSGEMEKLKQLLEDGKEWGNI